MNLKLIAIIRREEKHRASGDRRRKINHVVASYRGDDGFEYRKSFESYGEPIVPESGDNSEITKFKIQY
jgi:hypothetical protein